MGRTIHTYFWNDDLKGIKEVFIPSVGCSLYYIPRKCIDQILSEKSIFEVPSLYILVNDNTRKAYIGETDNFLERIKNHNSQKKFWEYVIMLYSTDKQISTSEVKYLEAMAYTMAQKAQIYDLSENCHSPKAPILPRYRKDFIEEFFGYVKLFVEFIGCSIFSLKYYDANGKRVFKRYSLNNSDYLNGCKFVRLIVETYIKEHAGVTYQDLQKIFPRIMMKGESGQVISTKEDAERMHNPLMAYKIFLKKTNKSIMLSDGTEIYVNTQTDKSIVDRFIAFALDQGWEYKEQ